MIAGGDGFGCYRGVPRPASFWARWSMRVVLRASQMLAMLDTGKYSNDLHSCLFLGASRFPEWGHRLRSCFATERDPAGHIITAMDDLSWWREEVLPLWLERVRPDRDLNDQSSPGSPPSLLHPEQS
jgi:hypothetical protein